MDDTPKPSELSVGTAVRTTVHLSHRLPRGSVGVVTAVSHYRSDRERPLAAYIEWQRGGGHYVYPENIKPIPLEQLTKGQKLWLVKRRLKKALEHD